LGPADGAAGAFAGAAVEVAYRTARERRNPAGFARERGEGEGDLGLEKAAGLDRRDVDRRRCERTRREAMVIGLGFLIDLAIDRR